MADGKSLCSGNEPKRTGIRADKRHMREADIDELLTFLSNGAVSDYEDEDEISDDQDEDFVPNDRVVDTVETSDSDETDESTDIVNDNTSKPSTSKSAPKSHTKAKKVEIQWKKKSFTAKCTDWEGKLSDYADSHETTRLPYDIFSSYLSDEFFQNAANLTNQYSLQTTGTNINTSAVEIRDLFSIHLVMGSLRYPRRRMYWSDSTRIPIVANTMSFNRFCKLRTNLHLVDNTQHDSDDTNQLWKVQPIIDKVLERCKSLELEEELSIDEQMVPFKGRLKIKQYIRGKPNPWGIKLFLLCGKSGMVHNVISYQGKSTPLDSERLKKFGLGPTVVLTLAEHIPHNLNHRLYFDNFFTSISLLKELAGWGILAAGTVRRDRLCKCPLTAEKALKGVNRGFCEEVVTSEEDVVVTAWLDNKLVTLASNYVGIGTLDEANRWDKSKKEFVSVPRPEVIQHYNRAMGGVDVFDALLSYYRTFIRSKKWTLRVIFHFSDIAVCNSWMEYRREADQLKLPKKKQMDLLEFRMTVAKALTTVNIGIGALPKKRGRPSLNESNESPTIEPQRKKVIRSEVPVEEARFDNFAHFPKIESDKSQRCAIKHCKGHTRIQCEKCKVFLCFVRERNCFRLYHIR